MKKFGKRSLVIALSLVFAGSVSVHSQQEAVPQQSTVTPVQQRELLRQPDGLVKLSQIVGDVTFTELEERWGEHDLRSLVNASAVVLTGEVTRSTTRLTPDGDGILTEFEITTNETLKGKPKQKLNVTVGGGLITLANGHRITIHTAASDGIKAGESYVFFLKKSDFGYQPVAGAVSALRVSRVDNTLHSLDLDPNRNPQLRREVEGINRAAVEYTIRDIALR